MPIIETIRDAPLADLVIIMALFAAFILGYMEGPVRRFLGIVTILLAFILAANTREIFGQFLAENWTQFPAGYDHLLAFGIVFAVLVVVLSVLVQGLYKRQELFVHNPAAEEIAGGVLGVVEGLLLLVIAIIILSSYTLPEERFPGEIDALRALQDGLIRSSHIAGAFRDAVVPAFVTTLSAFLPTELVQRFH